MILKVACKAPGEPEIFRSIQGEGPHAGHERTFIRLSGCNLHCVWCDTAYTWNWIGTQFAHERDQPASAHKFDPAKEIVKLEIADAAARVLADLGEGVVVTGGEPLMQAGAVAALIDKLREHTLNLPVEIETNGSIAPSEQLVSRVSLFVVSPKLAHSGNDAAIALNPDSLGEFAALDSAVFKFVARERDDIETVAAISRRLRIAPRRVYVMPEGADSETLAQRGRLLAGDIVAHGFNYSDRLHIHLFGEKRGV